MLKKTITSNLVATWFYLAFSRTSIISKTLVNLTGSAADVRNWLDSFGKLLKGLMKLPARQLRYGKHSLAGLKPVTIDGTILHFLVP